jgi:hypothetical protein
VREACQRWYGVDYTLFTTSPGAQYIVPKRYILSRPLEFWKTLHQAMYTDELDGYCQEALWYLAYMHRMNRHVGNHDQEKAKCEMIYSFSHELLRIDESA